MTVAGLWCWGCPGCAHQTCSEVTGNALMEKKQFLPYLDWKFYMYLFIIKFYHYIMFMLHKSIMLAHVQLKVKLHVLDQLGKPEL